MLPSVVRTKLYFITFNSFNMSPIPNTTICHARRESGLATWVPLSTVYMASTVCTTIYTYLVQVGPYRIIMYII